MLFICLLFTAFGLTVDDSYAVNLNENSIGLEDVDKLENSQNIEILEVDKGNEILSANIVVRGNTFEDIQNAINGANAGDTIYLTNEYTPGGNNSTIYVNKKLTITSASSAVLNGQGVSSILNIQTNGANSIISNLKFINAKGEVGSALYIHAKNVVVDGCSFDDNQCAHGGVLSSKYNLYIAENLTVENCNFTNNSGNFRNYSNAGALGAYGLNSKIINCIFDSNWVKSEGSVFGGAVQIGLEEPNYYALISDCTFINNKAIGPNGKSHGGAGCVRNGVNYINCVFINNTAGQGGALTFHSSGKLQNCTFINNTAVDRYGGAVSTGYLNDDNEMEMEINNCYFEGNDAPLGGAIQAMGLNIDIINSEFYENHANTYGGALNIEAVDVRVYDSEFRGNIAEVDGGAINTKGSNTLIKDSSFISNEAIPDYNKLNDGLGGAIYINSTQANIVNSDFYYNVARNGSAIYYDKHGRELNLKNNTLFENQAWVYHLPIYANDVYYGETEEFKAIIYGGNNIAKYNNLAVSNAIYNAADYTSLTIDGESPVKGATNNGKLYQDDREYNMEILLTVKKDDGSLIYNKTLDSSYLGEVSDELSNLPRPGRGFQPQYYFKNKKEIEHEFV